ncbi:protein LKAAEAR1 [Lemur catta]|uniref:protein LKAAEAR1 n=1 Tax=Lemur catta TaxID=9447 RepID=UPI001E26E5D3|nr:protein LKAAEAR1 [Lemur catta]
MQRRTDLGRKAPELQACGRRDNTAPGWEGSLLRGVPAPPPQPARAGRREGRDSWLPGNGVNSPQRAPAEGFPPEKAQGRRMQPPPKEAGRQGAPGARPGKQRSKGAPAAEPPKPGWTLTPERLAAMLPAQRHRHLLFGDLLEDVGAAASIFPRESAELRYRMPDPRVWAQSLERPAERQNRLLGVLKAAEARGRVRALRLRYTRMREQETAFLIQRQKSALAAIRLELFLSPQLKPARIPDPLDRQERRRVETILEESEGGTFPR